MGDWSIEILDKIDEKLEGVREKDIRFYRIDEFKRNIARVDEFSPTCTNCKKHKIEILETVNLIDDAINVPGKTRRKYDRLISQLSKHIQKEHGFYPPFYFTYLLSFFGIASGLAVGFLLSKIFTDNNILMYSIGFVAGVFPGYFIGSIKDKKIRSAKKLM